MTSQRLDAHHPAVVDESSRDFCRLTVVDDNAGCAEIVGVSKLIRRDVADGQSGCVEIGADAIHDFVEIIEQRRAANKAHDPTISNMLHLQARRA